MKALLVGSLDAAAEARLAAAGEVVRAPAGDETAICRLVADCDALVVRTHIPVTERVLRAGRKLRVVGVAGVGVDRVDLDCARRLGIEVLNRPGAASDAVAEFAVGLMLQWLRPTHRLGDEYRQGRFAEARRLPHGRELHELTVGIVGMGRIGSRVGRICAAGIRCRVLYNDIAEVGPFAYPAERVDKSVLWSAADVVSLHLPLTDETRGLVNADVLARLKPDALLVNTARGAIVDTAALAAALQSGRLGGAALDVTNPEPLPPEHVLFSLGNCQLTPHVAARTFRGIARMYAIVDDVISYLQVGADTNS